VAPSGECLRGESPPDRMLATPWRPLCLAAFGLNLVVAAVLRDSSVVVAVLRGSVGTIATCIKSMSCVAECCMLYNMCKVERFVLTILKEDYYYYYYYY